jgi:phosphoglycerate-specific signal transduction histidine kinase
MSITQHPPDSRRSWFDGTINIPTVISVIGAAVCATVFCVGLYNNVSQRVLLLEEHDRQQELHFQAIERDQASLRSDVKDQLKSIGADIKDTNSKLDQLLYNRAGVRPEIRGWTK